MKIPFFQQRPTEESAAVSPDALQQLRFRILNNVLLGALLFGVFEYAVVLNRSYERYFKGGDWPVLVVYTVALLWLFIITVFRRLPYRLRAMSLLVVVYLVSLATYQEGGMTTDGAIFLLTLIALSTLFFGVKGAIYSLVVSIGTVALVGTLMSRHVVVPLREWSSDAWAGWVNRGVSLLLVGVAVGLSLSTMLGGLQIALNRAVTSAAQMEEEQQRLRRQVADVERRSLQIRTTAELLRTISGLHEAETLLQQAVNLIRERFGLYYVGAFLLDESRRYAVLRAGTGEAGAAMLAARYRLSLSESSMVGWTILNRRARIALDVGQDAVRFANPYLPATRSELALPLIVGERAIGALTIQSDQPAAFDEDDITIMQNIADTLAIALESARLFAEQEATLEEIRALQGQYVMEAWSRRLPTGEAAEYTVGAPPPAGAAVLDVPLTLRDQIIGQITLEGESEWSPEERSLIEAVATQAALALENARLLEESQQMALHERLTAEITRKVWASQNIETILQTAVRELGRALRAEEASIHLELEASEPESSEEAYE